MRPIKSKKIIFLIIILALIILHTTRALSPIENLIIKIFNPFLVSFHGASSQIQSLFIEQTDKRGLLDEIQKLKTLNNELTVENAKLKTFEIENALLREHLNFLEKNKLKYTLANIIGRSRSDWDQTNASFTINKGKKDNITEGLAALSGDGVLIGKIIRAEDEISQVCLTISKNCKFAATTENKNFTSGIVEGELGLTIKMDFIPQTEKIKAGDIITTSGLEENIPKGLVIGKTTKIIQENNDVWQSANIEPLVDHNKLNIVSVILK